MNAISNLLQSTCQAISFGSEIIGYTVSFGLSLRRELLDHVIVLSQAHVDKLLREFIDECNHVARPHQGLDGDTPFTHDKPEHTSGPEPTTSLYT